MLGGKKTFCIHNFKENYLLKLVIQIYTKKEPTLILLLNTKYKKEQQEILGN
ncbi:hypothetical protein HJ01_01394 [Flavobacterium frigoris PS1]|uniref:Uncharacterized protein n=1 Tax=Flavobacterium frigoris (strain PS1) TaxID=1086011 RepID=H7FQD3_FLAFP|nr:hypothetical protein HJ01_01394 [Flavobacterium frigoris PS1]